jgi:hypothetical protein
LAIGVSHQPVAHASTRKSAEQSQQRTAQNPRIMPHYKSKNEEGDSPNEREQQQRRRETSK